MVNKEKWGLFMSSALLLTSISLGVVPMFNNCELTSKWYTRFPFLVSAKSFFVGQRNSADTQ